MNTSGEAADQVVRMSMEVGEAALKISGAGAKQLAVLLYAILKEQKKTRNVLWLFRLERITMAAFLPWPGFLMARLAGVLRFC